MSELNKPKYSSGSWQDWFERSNDSSVTKSCQPSQRTSDDYPSEHAPDAVIIDGYMYERFPVRDGSGRKLGDVYMKLGNADGSPTDDTSLEMMLDLATPEI